MLTLSSLKNRLRILTLLLLCQLPAYAQVAQPNTPEIDFTSSYAIPLANQAAQLGNAVAIYQYAYNNFIFETYHGSRSGSVNTFLGLHGSDVDIASTLIAMLRSQNIPARYAVGTITLTAAQINNWLGASNVAVAVQLLLDQGIQKVTNNTTTVSFEHVWVEASIPYDQYRGVPTPTAVDCTQSTNATRCLWVPMDASFKQFTYNNYGLNPYASISFNYGSYYGAILNNDPTQLNLNPLTILENQIAVWLQTNYAGHTLDDVANVGQIIPINDGLLPASLPYLVGGTVRTYDSVALHDAEAPPTCNSSCAEVKPWAKYLTVKYSATGYDNSANPYPYTITSTPILEATLNNDRLTLYNTAVTSITNVPVFTMNLGGSQVFITSTVNFTVNGQPVTATAGSPYNVPNYLVSAGQPFTATLSLTGAPDPTGGSNDKTITATYGNLNIQSFFVIATGGSYSNWAQVHNAATELIANNGYYPIVLNPAQNGQIISPFTEACDTSTGLNCPPSVDINGSGVYNANDPLLLNDTSALDALTGGLMYVAAMQYYASYMDDINRVNQLMQTKTSATGFVGMVSSVYEAEYLNNTAFSVMPGGLLIDMRGVQFGGTYASNASSPTQINSIWELMGHIGSSLEHETWQALTGYDAVSTVRGFQMALSQSGTTMLSPITSLSGLQSNYGSFGYGSSVPSSFTAKTFKVCSSSPYTWNTACSGASDTFNTWTNTSSPSAFDTFLSSVSTSTSALQQEVQTYVYDTTSQYAEDYTYYWANCTNNLANKIAALPASTTFPYINSSTPANSITQTCDTSPIAGTQASVSQAQALANVYADWSGAIVPFINNAIAYLTGDIDQFDYFDESQGFSTSGRMYRSYPPAVGQYSSPTIGAIRTDFGTLTNSSTTTGNTTVTIDYTLSYTMPSTTVVTPYNNFEVYIRNLDTTTTTTTTTSSTKTVTTDYDYSYGFKINNLGL
jgi:hypothetical protein